LWCNDVFAFMSSDCLFCRIIAGDIPSRKVYEDDDVFVFHDIHPFARVHLPQGIVGVDRRVDRLIVGNAVPIGQAVCRDEVDGRCELDGILPELGPRAYDFASCNRYLD